MLARLVFIYAAIAMSIGGAQAQPGKLAQIDALMREQFPDIGHITVDDLQQGLRGGETILLLDTRSHKEFAVSHLPGALHVPPNASAKQLIALIGDRAKAAHVVIYCSVGVRSSKLAARTRRALDAAGASRVDNLRGGIFAWHNQDHPLEDAYGTTALVHPYDKTWGRLLNRQSLISKRPKERS